MKLSHLTLIALLSAAIATPVIAQPGPGMGDGMGQGRGGRFAFDQNNTVGWTLMSKEERAAHQQKMWSFTNYAECKAYQQQHHDDMLARAQAQGKTLPAPHANACDRMQARGLVK
jgi:hypothetical protein